MIFDSKLECSLQVENSVRKARSALQGLRVINKYFTLTERLTLITSFFTLASTMDHKFGSYLLSKASLRQNCFQLLGQHLNYWTGTGHSKTFTKNITEQHLLNSRNTQLPFLYMTWSRKKFQKTSGSTCNLASKMMNEIQGSAFQQTIGSSVDSTVCQIGSNQLTMRSINNGSVCQEMLTKQVQKGLITEKLLLL